MCLLISPMIFRSENHECGSSNSPRLVDLGGGANKLKQLAERSRWLTNAMTLLSMKWVISPHHLGVRGAHLRGVIVLFLSN